jgi:RHS repeat-associated protein
MTRSPDDSISLAGQRWDWQAELHYYGARFYDPRLASFLTHDPVREHANPYAYVGWNPVSRTDPSGTFSINAFNLYGLVGGSAFAEWYASWSGGFAQNFGGVGGANSSLGGFIASSVYGFDQSFSVGGIRVGGVEAGATGGVGGFVSSLASDFGISFSLGGVGLTPGEAGFLAALLASVSAAPATVATFAPTSIGQLVSFPMTLLASLLFFAFSGFQAPLAVRFGGGPPALFFGGNPRGGYATGGYAISGPDTAFNRLAGGSLTVADALYLAHEFGHVGQYAVLGPAFLAAYTAQFPAAVPTAFATRSWDAFVQFNVLENYFLGGAPTTYQLQALP